jgi:hypothetical protein
MIDAMKRAADHVTTRLTCPLGRLEEHLALGANANAERVDGPSHLPGRSSDEQLKAPSRIRDWSLMNA